MCAGGQYWSGIGRLVFALSGAQLADIAPDGGRSLRLSSREVFDRGNVPIDVDGPCEELGRRGACRVRRLLVTPDLPHPRPVCSR